MRGGRELSKTKNQLVVVFTEIFCVHGHNDYISMVYDMPYQGKAALMPIACGAGP
jgi:hypothetical protein